MMTLGAEEISWFRHLLDRSTFSDLCLLQLRISLPPKVLPFLLFLSLPSLSFFLLSKVGVAGIFESRS